MVAGDEISDKSDNSQLSTRAIPIWNETDVEGSNNDFYAFLMGNHGAHKGLLDAPYPSTRQGRSDAIFNPIFEKYEKALEDHEDRAERAFSYLYKATSARPLVQVIRDLYIKDCKNSNPVTTPTAKVLLERLKTRFEKRSRFRLKDVKDEFDKFMVLPLESLDTATTRHAQLILQLLELKEPPTDSAMKLSITAGLENGENCFQILKTLIAMKPDDETYDEIVDELKNWQATQGSLVIPKDTPTINNLNDEAPCDYCNIRGHGEESCRKKQSDKAWHARNRGGKGAGRGGKGGGKGGKGGSKGAGGRGNYGGRGGKGSKGGGKAQGHGGRGGGGKS